MGEGRLEERERELLRGAKIDDGVGQIPAGKECAGNPCGLARLLERGVSGSASFTFSAFLGRSFTEWAMFSEVLWVSSTLPAS